MEDNENENDHGTGGVRQCDHCIREVTAVFPDICPQYLETVAAPLHFSTQNTINYILDLGRTYKKREQPIKTVAKRKRGDNEQDDDLEEKLCKDRRLYTSENREKPALKNQTEARKMIAGDFPLVPMKIVREFLSDHNSLYSAYLALDKTIRQQPDKPLSWTPKKRASLLASEYDEKNIEDTIKAIKVQQDVELMEELRAARLARRQADLRRQREIEALEVEKENFEEAQIKGETKDCECCFNETPYNQLVHCDGENAHSFCITCARRNAEIQAGLSKYKLGCLSTEGCSAGFSLEERKKFLVESLAYALDVIEQDENLRLAGLPGLTRCPFCPYAEVYPSVAKNKEFVCRRPGCMITSCRLCNLKSHIPNTCKEAVEAKGLDARRQVEEAMSKALIRNCNKCNTPFVKKDGCNKMTCPKLSCRNMQCYVCSQTCDYDHFDDRKRGGRVGNCPLFDNCEKRHREEVEEAEKNAKQKVLQDNPDLEPKILDFTISSEIEKGHSLRIMNPAAQQIHQALLMQAQQMHQAQQIHQTRPVQAQQMHQVQQMHQAHAQAQAIDRMHVRAIRLEARNRARQQQMQQMQRQQAGLPPQPAPAPVGLRSHQSPFPQDQRFGSIQQPANPSKK
ncbi:hypothetical protein ACHAPO_003095 [Fusarium lateritium]